MQQIAAVTINNVKVGVRRDDDADIFVGFCPRFQVYSQGETTEECVESVREAISLRIITAFEHGRFHTVLRQAGFDRLIEGDQRPSPDEEFIAVQFREGVEVSEVDIEIPLGAILQQRSNEVCQR